jgi:hypothetical protein
MIFGSLYMRLIEMVTEEKLYGREKYQLEKKYR